MQTTQQINPSSIQTPAALHPAVEVGTVSLKVANLTRSLQFYTEIIGLRLFRQEGGTAQLGAGSRRILTLEEIPGAKPLARNTTGLYHAAILFPNRRALALKMAQIATLRYPFGQSDHLVSEAFYLSDPDENGLELYRDRPRSEWSWENGRVKMAIDPIDFQSFFAGIQGSDVSSGVPAPDGTKLGHMHLRVADIPLAEAFYHGVLGFDITARMPNALFVSAGGYHHHLGMNTWESLGAKPPVEPSAGLREFSISLPNQAELERLVKQVKAAGVQVEEGAGESVILDPFQNRIRLVV
jgi:catechol 2,3-dioxygenase